MQFQPNDPSSCQRKYDLIADKNVIIMLSILSPDYITELQMYM